jgi:hypothetical protein
MAAIADESHTETISVLISNQNLVVQQEGFAGDVMTKARPREEVQRATYSHGAQPRV